MILEFYMTHMLYNNYFLKKLLNFWNIILSIYKKLFFQILDNDF